MNYIEKTNNIHRAPSIRTAMLFIAITFFAAIVLLGSAYDDGYDIARHSSYPLIASGTMGDGGAPWQMHYNGTIEIGSGVIYQCVANIWYQHLEHIPLIVISGPVAASYASTIRGIFHWGGSTTGRIDGMHYLDTSGITSMYRMFYSPLHPHYYLMPMPNLQLMQCIAALDTSNVTNMSLMFANNTLPRMLITLSNWDTGRVTNMSGMFSRVQNDSSIDLSGWNTSSVTNMSDMFFNVRLQSLDLSGWDTRNVQRMDRMFAFANNLQQITLGENFVFTNVAAGLPPVPATGLYTGYWQNVGSGTTYYPRGEFVFTSEELMRYYDGAVMADTWVWQPRFHEDEGHPVILRPMGGYIDGSSDNILVFVPHGGTLGALAPPNPIYPIRGREFRGWRDVWTMIIAPISTTPIYSPRTFEAIFRDVNWEFSLRLSLDGGYVGGSPIPIFIRRPSFSTSTAYFGVDDIPIPVRAGHTFLGWREEGTDELLTAEEVSAAVSFQPIPVTAPIYRSFVAQWEALLASTPTPTPVVTPSPTLTPTPGVMVTPSPKPTPSPTPTPAPMASPTPTPIPARVNPQTSNTQPGFIIIAAIVSVGLSSIGIIHFAKKHNSEIQKNRKTAVRSNRDKRIVDITNDL